MIGPVAALSPVSQGIYAALNVSALTGLLAGGVHDDVPQAPSYPFVQYEVQLERDLGGFGTKALPQLEIRVHVFSQYAGWQEAETILAAAETLLHHETPAVTGYATWYCRAQVERPAVKLDDQELNGVKVKELVGFFDLYVESTS